MSYYNYSYPYYTNPYFGDSYVYEPYSVYNRNETRNQNRTTKKTFTEPKPVNNHQNNTNTTNKSKTTNTHNSDNTNNTAYNIYANAYKLNSDDKKGANPLESILTSLAGEFMKSLGSEIQKKNEPKNTSKTSYTGNTTRTNNIFKDISNMNKTANNTTDKTTNNTVNYESIVLELRSELEKVRNENRNLQKELNFEKEKNINLDNGIKKLKDIYQEHFLSKQTQTQTQKQNIDKIINSYENSIIQLQDELDSRPTTEEHKLLIEKLEKKCEENEILKDKTEHLESNIQELQKTISSLNITINNLDNEIQQYHNKLKNCKQIIPEHEQVEKSLKNSLSHSSSGSELELIQESENEDYYKSDFDNNNSESIDEDILDNANYNQTPEQQAREIFKNLGIQI
jgi:chromosome segregation ATPase